MPLPPPTTLFPVEEREVYIAKEATPGVQPAGSPGTAIPMLTMKPSDKPMMLLDESMQGSMGDIYAGLQGPLIANLDLGGNFYGDTFGHLLYNLLGDCTSTGTAVAPTATTNGSTPAGQLFITVVSGGASFTVGMQVWIQDAGSPAANEIVTVGGGSTSTNVVLTTPTRFAHATATPITNTSAPYTHTFSLLNQLIGAANGAGQPPTHQFTDRTGIPATGLAAQYNYSCLSELVITGNAEKLLPWTGKAVCYTRQIPAAPVGVVNTSNVQTYPSWRSVTGLGSPAAYTYTATSASPCVFTAAGSAFANGQAIILQPTGLPTGFSAGVEYFVVSVAGATFSLAAAPGGTAINSSSTGTGTLLTAVRNIGEWQYTLSRAVKPYWSNQGSQYPYVIGRGKQGAKGKLTFSPAIDESPLVALLANTQPQQQIFASNGLTGVNLVSLQIDVLLGMYETSDLDDSSELFGWQVPFTAIHTATSTGGITTTGASGGKGAVKVTLTCPTPLF